MSQAGSTTIAISVETKELIRTLGEKGETYDAIIRRVFHKVGMKDLDARWNSILENDEFLSLENL
ncbi:MAG: hypothetical protein WCK53_01375 [Methanomicrobiales archaeon]